MNADIKELFTEYAGLTRDTPAAALLVSTDVLSRPAVGPVAEPAGSPFHQILNCGHKA